MYVSNNGNEFNGRFVYEPKFEISFIQKDDVRLLLKVDDDGNVLLNGKEIESLDDHKQAIGILIRAMCSIIR
jgi:hypothetical protein